MWKGCSLHHASGADCFQPFPLRPCPFTASAPPKWHPVVPSALYVAAAITAAFPCRSWAEHQVLPQFPKCPPPVYHLEIRRWQPGCRHCSLVFASSWGNYNNFINKRRWESHMVVLPCYPRMGKQGDQEFKAILSYIGSWRPSQTTQDYVSKEPK